MWQLPWNQEPFSHPYQLITHLINSGLFKSSWVHSDMVMLQFFFSSCVSGSTDDLNPFQARCSGYLLNSTTDEDCIWVCIHFFHNIYAQDIILVMIGQIFVKYYKYKVEEERDTFFRTRSVWGGGGVSGEFYWNKYNRFHHLFFYKYL